MSREDPSVIRRRGLAPPNGVFQPTGRKVVIQAMEFFTFNSSGKVTRIESLTNDLGAITQVTAK